MDDEFGLTWIANVPKIKLLPDHDARKPYPLDWDEQDHLFATLPRHLREMALFAVNTGCRDGEVYNLRWEWEVPTPLFFRRFKSGPTTDSNLGPRDYEAEFLNWQCLNSVDLTLFFIQFLHRCPLQMQDKS